MDSIIVCNTAEDTLSKIELENYSVKNLPLDLGEKPVGPHGAIIYDNKIVTANNYNNTISIIDAIGFNELKSIYVGAHPNDVRIFDDKAYVSCGDSDSILVIDIKEEKILFDIMSDKTPHSLELDNENGILYVSNMDGNTISVIDCSLNKVLRTIKAPEYPTKILLSKDKRMLYICESYLGQEVEGYITLISTENYNTIGRIKVGLAPVDLWNEEDNLYVTNFTEGSISIIDLKRYREIKKIYVGGMPRGIVKKNQILFVGDYISGKVKAINIKEKTIKNIAVGKEPNAILLIENHH